MGENYVLIRRSAQQSARGPQSIKEQREKKKNGEMQHRRMKGKMDSEGQEGKTQMESQREWRLREFKSEGKLLKYLKWRPIHALLNDLQRFTVTSNTSNKKKLNYEKITATNAGKVQDQEMKVLITFEFNWSKTQFLLVDI